MDNPNSGNEWLTIKEVSDITGKSKAAIRTWINRNGGGNGHVRVKKIKGDRYSYWLIHKEELGNLSEPERVKGTGVPSSVPERVEANIITVEYYDKQRSKWENEKTELIRTYEQGLMMYRFKFEELDRKLKLLPAPPEVITQEFEKVKSELETTQQDLSEVNQALHKLEEKRQHLELSLQAKQEAHSGLLSEREALSHQIDKAKELQGILQEQKAKLEEELETLRRDSQEQEEKLSHKVKDLEQEKEDMGTGRKQAEERAEQLDRERKILEERLKQKEEERRRLSEELEQEKGRAWWKKLFGMK